MLMISSYATLHSALEITVTVACWSSLGCSPSIEFLKKKQKCESIIIVTSNFLGIWWRLLEPQFAARLDFVHWRLTMRDEKFGTLFLYRISVFPIPWWPHLCRRIDQRHDWLVAGKRVKYPSSMWWVGLSTKRQCRTAKSKKVDSNKQQLILIQIWFFLYKVLSLGSYI